MIWAFIENVLLQFDLIQNNTTYSVLRQTLPEKACFLCNANSLSKIMY